MRNTMIFYLLVATLGSTLLHQIDAADLPYRITGGWNTRKCLGYSDFKTINWRKCGTFDQLWNYDGDSGYIKNFACQKCLKAVNASEGRLELGDCSPDATWIHDCSRLKVAQDPELCLDSLSIRSEDQNYAVVAKCPLDNRVSLSQQLSFQRMETQSGAEKVQAFEVIKLPQTNTCLSYSDHQHISWVPCGKKNQLWAYESDTGLLRNAASDKCLKLSKDERSVELDECQANSTWIYDHSSLKHALKPELCLDKSSIEFANRTSPAVVIKCYLDLEDPDNGIDNTTKLTKDEAPVGHISETPEVIRLPFTNKCLRYSDPKTLWLRRCGAEDKVWLFDYTTGLIRDSFSQNCLKVSNSSEEHVELGDCNRDAQWIYDKNRLKWKRKPELCLENSGAKTDDYNPAIVLRCWAADSWMKVHQQWSFDDTAKKTAFEQHVSKSPEYIKLPFTNQCLGYSTTQGVYLRWCGSDHEQLWWYDSRTGFLRNKGSGRCLTVPDSSKDWVEVGDCTQEAGWIFDRSRLRLKRKPELCLDNTSGKAEEYSSVVIKRCWEESNWLKVHQSWNFEDKRDAQALYSVQDESESRFSIANNICYIMLGVLGAVGLIKGASLMGWISK